MEILISDLVFCLDIINTLVMVRAKQQQNVDDLSRDVAHANQTLSPIFDKEKEQQRMQTL
ncbi:hypothetical protein L2C91_00825 [Rosenbergiella epipactidis]|nr:hypothetical protein [Rosenbergiella epipactidis]MCL9666946.1 hypothetical protein [Rosenbergiella epipactidis]